MFHESLVVCFFRQSRNMWNHKGTYKKHIEPNNNTTHIKIANIFLLLSNFIVNPLK